MFHDMTQLLLNPDIPWGGTLPEIEEHFHPWVHRIEFGLYVQYFENDSPLPVFDKNRDFSRNGSGAHVIYEHGASLKPGKFQGGFLRRRRQDADHLHRARTDAFGSTYRSCLKFCLLLDLSRGPFGNPVAIKGAERRLKRNVDEAIREHELAHSAATRRGDWRKLRSPTPVDPLKEMMHAALVDVSKNGTDIGGLGRTT